MGGVLIAAALGVLGLISLAPAGDLPPWFARATELTGHLIGGVIPVLLSWWVALTALRQRSRRGWAVPGICLTAALGTGLQLSFAPAIPSAAASLSARLGLPSLAHLFLLVGAGLAPMALMPRSPLA